MPTSPSQTFILALIIALPSCTFCIQHNIFHDLTSQDHFVDKSEMLKELFEGSLTNDSYFYVNVPSGFGKTVNLDMIHTFASINLDESGEPTAPNDSVIYELFRGLKIGKYSDIVENHLGRYPILHLDFFGIANSNTTIEQLTLDLNALLWYELDQFPQLKNITGYSNVYGISQADISFMRTLNEKSLTIDQITEALASLSKILYLYLNQTKVIVLVDDYDLTAQDSLTLADLYTVPVYEYLNKMLANAFVKSKPYIKFALMTGVTTLAFSIDETFKNIVTHQPFLDEHLFTSYFGYTETDLESLFEKYDCQEEEKTQIKSFYEPYLTSKNQTFVYNTYCISEYFKNRKYEPNKPDLFQTYWADREEPGRITNFLINSEYRAKLERLMVENQMVARFNKLFAPDALEEFVKLRERFYRGIEKRHVVMFYKYTFEIGYLSHTRTNQTLFELPNFDAKQAAEKDLKLYYDMNFKNSTD